MHDCQSCGSNNCCSFPEVLLSLLLLHLVLLLSQPAGLRLGLPQLQLQVPADRCQRNFAAVFTIFGEGTFSEYCGNYCETLLTAIFLQVLARFSSSHLVFLNSFASLSLKVSCTSDISDSRVSISFLSSTFSSTT